MRTLPADAGMPWLDERPLNRLGAGVPALRAAPLAAPSPSRANTQMRRAVRVVRCSAADDARGRVRG